MSHIYLGVDDHKQFVAIAAMNGEGEIIRTEPRVLKTPFAIGLFLNSLGEGLRYKAVLETGRNWGVTYDILENIPSVEEVLLANPFKVKTIAYAFLKTETVDATTLAHLLRVNYIPKVYVPPKEVRVIKYLIRPRTFLVAIKT